MSIPAARLICTTVAGGALLAGCGVSTKNAQNNANLPPPPQRAATPLVQSSRLPHRPSGVIDIDGRSQGSLTPTLIASYKSGGGSAAVNEANNGEPAAFGELCNGQIDVAESARPISQTEFAACQRNGVNPVQFQVAADAVVLAIKNETDVGGDCLTVAQVKAIFQAGSPVSNWSQLGFYDVPMKVTGPNQDANAFSFFGRFVLGSETPALTDLRSDYVAQPTDRNTRLAVVGTNADIKNAKFLQSAQASLAALRKSLGDAQKYVATTRFQVVKGRHDKRSAPQQAKDRANFNRARSNLRTLRRDLPPAVAFYDKTASAAQRVGARNGVLGYFRYSYYTDFEEQLRPLEIDDGSRRPALNCIFPSQATITNASFPLARQLLLTTTVAELQRPEIKNFLLAVDKYSQTDATQKGFVPLPDQTRVTQDEWLNGQKKPSVVFYQEAPASRTQVRGTGTKRATTTTTTTASSNQATSTTSQQTSGGAVPAPSGGGGVAAGSGG